MVKKAKKAKKAPKVKRRSLAAGKLGPLLRKAKQDGWADWVRSTADERAVLHGCRFDPAAAEHVFEFFRRFLRHSKGRWAGDPFELLAWERDDLLGPIFGWKRENDTRRFRKAYAEITKKNGKSTIAAGVGIYLLVGDGEAGPEIYTTATKQAQASIVHGEAIEMVKRSPTLKRRLRINATTKVITYERAAGKYASLAADGPGVEGINASGVIFDELHAWRDRRFWDALEYAGAAREQWLWFMITTAGVFDKESIGWQEHEYALGILDGSRQDDDYFAYICCADPDDDLADPKVQAKANPSFGAIIAPEELAKAVSDAAERPVALNKLKRYRFNIWVEQLEAVIDLVKWDACDGAVVEKDLIGRRCFSGLDLASRRDITCLVHLFPPTDDDDLWRVLPRFWVPSENASKREKDDRVPYLTWARQGWLTLTKGNVVDYATIEATIQADGKAFGVVGIAADPWNLEYLRQRVDPNGDRITEYGQGFRDMSPPAKELIDVLVPSGKLAHGGHPILRWMAANLALREDANANVAPDKKRSAERIDGMVGLIMALGRAMTDDDSPSVYETDGLLTLG
jgi:phage terminase large subunit-like protein